jgi:hypothetical protein
MDWILFWTGAMAVMAAVSILGSVFGYLRKLDGIAIDGRITSADARISALTDDVNKKLSEAEFRRFESKHEAALLSIKESTDNRIDKLEIKLDEKFDRLFDMLVKK